MFLTKNIALVALTLSLLFYSVNATCLSSTLNDPTEICGVATGDFQLLGSMCMPGSTNLSHFDISLSFANVGSEILESDLDKYYVNFFDDQDTSYPVIARPTGDDVFDYQNCSTKVQYARGFWKITDTTPTISNNIYTYSRNLGLSESFAREWYFIISACESTGPIKLNSYTIESEDAIDCSTLYATDHVAYIVVVVFLTLIAVAAAFSSYICWKKTQVPQLLSMDDTGYNEL
jgi:hypothetical protein